MLIRELLTNSVHLLESYSSAHFTPATGSGQESSISSSPSGTPVALLCPVIRDPGRGGCVLAGMCEGEKMCIHVPQTDWCLSFGVLTLQGPGRSSPVSVWCQNVLLLNHLMASDSQCECGWFLVFACLLFLRIDFWKWDYFSVHYFQIVFSAGPNFRATGASAE